MLYRLGGLLALSVLLAGPARAQLITDPARALAARDTLLQQAAQLRLRAEQTSPFFKTNSHGRGRRRVVVQGISGQNSGALPATGVRQTQWTPDNVVWRHVTCYRRNGRLLERYRLSMGHKTLLRERRLNGNVIWLSIPVAYSNVMGTAIRHRGLFLRTGYLTLDNDQYVLPRPLL
ncbi:hypothetical protein [Hymenobacter negativus]|uniref:Uncharacterized protein n=1 Tax=Hymenobacter negativus TaxID=2795026 RepID=A0ABS3QCD5_9BACT|nr:hypothetical protein [Hymenobacter negativus]MBO2008906.1 hypothetical protein [Hymenobacter negativus]